MTAAPVVRARQLRKTMTRQEIALWSQLKQLRPQGLHFRRQAPLLGCILDFVCFAKKLIVECDGAQHADSERDRRRDALFAQQGFRTLRFWNHEIDANLEGVVHTVMAAAGAPWQ